MDTAMEIGTAIQTTFVAAGFRTKADGSIDDRDAEAAEKAVKSALKQALRAPINEEGNKGHVSDFGYRIDRTNDALTSEELLTTTSIRPLFYPKTISSEYGFSKAV